MGSERTVLTDRASAEIIVPFKLKNLLDLQGRYSVVCKDLNGKILWEDTINNIVTMVGRNFVLDTVLSGSSYSVTGPYMGLISSVGWSEVNINDTMSSHSGWNEAGISTYYPYYSGDRKTCVFNNASNASKSLSSPLSFSIVTYGGTVKGCFIVLGSTASATKGSTGGVLYSCGLFEEGDRDVSPQSTLQVSFTAGALPT